MTTSHTVHVLSLTEAGSPSLLGAYPDQETARLELLDLWLQDLKQINPDFGPENLSYTPVEDSEDRWSAEFLGDLWTIETLTVRL